MEEISSSIGTGLSKPSTLVEQQAQICIKHYKCMCFLLPIKYLVCTGGSPVKIDQRNDKLWIQILCLQLFLRLINE